jgi:hypothetical protein
MLPGANRSQGSCKHESGHDSVDTVDTSTAALRLYVQVVCERAVVAGD